MENLTNVLLNNGYKPCRNAKTYTMEQFILTKLKYIQQLNGFKVSESNHIQVWHIKKINTYVIVEYLPNDQVFVKVMIKTM